MGVTGDHFLYGENILSKVAWAKGYASKHHSTVINTLLLVTRLLLLIPTS